MTDQELLDRYCEFDGHYWRIFDNRGDHIMSTVKRSRALAVARGLAEDLERESD